MTPKIRREFEQFDRRNPQIYKEFKALSIQARKSGRKRYGAWAIINVLRWNRDIQTDGEPFKICNDYIGLYARKLAGEDPYWKSFFGLKRLKNV